jgi:hypothetical protein
MFDEELQRIWQNAPEREQVRFDYSRLLIELKNQIGQDDKQIKKRNATEIISASFVILFVGYMTFFYSFSYQVQIANYLIMLWGIYLIGLYGYLRKQKPELPSGSNLKTYLQQYKIYLLKEKRFSERAILLTIIPVLPGFTLLMLSDRYTWFHVGLIGGLLLLISIIAHLINRHAARKKRQPVIDSIDEALRSLAEKE